MNKKIVAIAAILAGACLTGCMPQASAVGHFDRIVTVNGPVRLELANGSGDSRISAGSSGVVEIHAAVRVHAWSWRDAQRRLEEIEANPPVSQDVNLIRVGDRDWRWSSMSASYDYTITVPADTEVRAVAGSGSLRVDGVQGPANFVVGSGSISATGVAKDTQAIVGSGDVRLADMGGEVDVTAGSGSVHIDRAKGEIRARAGSGGISIREPGDTVVAQSGSGGIDVRDATADLRLRTGSGEIRVDGNPGATNFWDLHAASGGVSLRVPPDASFRLYARTGSGNIDVWIPSVSEESSGRHEYQGRVGDGKARVEIETASGGVSLR
ncbi:MAG: DUF4097 family beta strand repeat-containing protein [Candidatus Acidiferrales bacterium]